MSVIDLRIGIALGEDATSYDTFTVEPFFAGVQYPREVFGATGVFDDGLPYALLRFPALEFVEYRVNLTKAGVYSAKTAVVSLRTYADDGQSYLYWNGQAKQPTPAERKRDQLRYTDVLLLIRRLKAQS